MSTNEIAKRLVELCKANDFATAYTELYSESIVSIEPDGWGPKRTEGMEEKAKKSQAWQDGIEEMYGSEIGEPIISNNSFAFIMSIDAKMKGQERFVMRELCVYEVKDGKIVLEQFFA